MAARAATQMKMVRTFLPKNLQAFTLVELLVVIAIIAILAAILLPALIRAKVEGQIKTAKLEMSQLATAINSYYSTYSFYPVSSNVMAYAQTAGAGSRPDDFTYGGSLLQATLGLGAWTTNNSEVIASLMDITAYPASGAPTINVNHVKNPQQTKFLSARMVSSSTDPGVGPDLIYRDPWGNPYVISLDLNYDEKCMDALYRRDSVNGPTGFNGQTSLGGANNFSHNGGTMIWSAGPDGRATQVLAIQEPNKDNVLSWK